MLRVPQGTQIISLTTMELELLESTNVIPALSTELGACADPWFIFFLQTGPGSPGEEF